MAPAVFKLRILLALACFANLAVVGAYYGWVIANTTNTRQAIFGKKPYVYNWADYGIIGCSAILFFAYIYSIWVKKAMFCFGNRIVRAVLMLIPGGFLLGIMVRAVHHLIESLKLSSDKSSNDNFTVRIDPFTCIGFGNTDGPCTVLKCYVSFPIVVGFFVIIEVLVTLLRGPLHPTKPGYY
ncbi:hypothetical protein EC957_006781 [Mortierella hygrophila]|uniref:Uncharacterized protein n=1 Tax=Mortierella hygrophila TaxID=979708 RepID=A0A9P6EZF2_9FUNG|nr:hypothetical protein EC957_006781 [Mortierella hygrophila]